MDQLNRLRALVKEFKAEGASDEVISFMLSAAGQPYRMDHPVQLPTGGMWLPEIGQYWTDETDIGAIRQEIGPAWDNIWAAMGRKGGLLGGKATTEAKKKAARQNGKMGGRPRKKVEIMEEKETTE